jgi:hypothetical protein
LLLELTSNAAREGQGRRHPPPTSIERRPQTHRVVCNDNLGEENSGIFPARLKLGGNYVAWLEGEVFDWINSKILERDSALVFQAQNTVEGIEAVITNIPEGAFAATCSF